MSAALDRAREVNSAGMDATMTFLTEPPPDRAKANYISTTYMQLARQMARFAIKGSIHVPTDHLGSRISGDAAASNIRRVLQTCDHYGIFCWYDVSDSDKDLRIVLKTSTPENCGLAFQDQDAAAKFLSKPNKKVEAYRVKVRLGQDHSKWKPAADAIMKRKGKITLLCPSDNIVGDVLKGISKSSAKRLGIEFELGGSAKYHKEAAKKGVSVCMYMPFGMDWVRYAINRIPEERLRVFARGFLSPDLKAAMQPGSLPKSVQK